MNIEDYSIYDEKDVKIRKNGIYINDTFFNKKEIANTFNELILMRDVIKNHPKNNTL